MHFDKHVTAQAALVPFRGLGTHLLADFRQCQQLPADSDALQDLLERAAHLMGCTVVQSVFHQFNPYGLSGVVIIAESHLAVHTWPEHSAACVDFFTCSDALQPLQGLRLLYDAFAAGEMELKQIHRGRGEESITS